MEIHFLSLKRFKRNYFQILLANLVIVLGTYILIRNRIFLFGPFLVDKWSILALNVTILVSVYIFNAQVRKRLAHVAKIDDFDEKVAQYEGIYISGLYWY